MSGLPRSAINTLPPNSNQLLTITIISVRQACPQGITRTKFGGIVMPIRLAIVESQTLVRYGLRELLAKHPDIEIVAECASMAEAPRKLGCARPDVVTVAVGLPDGDGRRLARELRDPHAGPGLLILALR